MPMPLPASTDVVIKTANPPIITLFTVRCTQNVEINWQKELTAVEAIGIVEPYLDDLTMINQVFKVTGDLVSTIGAAPEDGNDSLYDQYNQFKLALDRNELLAIELWTAEAAWVGPPWPFPDWPGPDGVPPIIEKGHFQSGSITFVQGEVVTARVNFDFVVGSDYMRI